MTATAVRLFLTKVPQLLSLARIGTGLSQRDLAAKLHVGVHTISRVECRHQPADPAMVMQAARMMGENANDLAVQAAYEITGVCPAWPDGSKYDDHPLARMVVDKKEDTEADQAIADSAELLALAEYPAEAKEKATVMTLEMLEGVAARIDFIRSFCNRYKLDYMALWAAVHERRKSAGIVRRVA